MESLKIGLVVDDTLDKTDGVQQYVLALGAWLSSNGHEVRYLVGETKRRDIPGIYSLSRNVAVRFNGNRLSIPLPASKKAIRSIIRQEAFDVLHVQVPYSPFMAKRVIAAASPTTVVVGTFHILPNSKVAEYGNKLLALWLQKSLRRFDSMVSVSPAAAGFVKSSYGITTPVLPNVLDYKLFHNAAPFERYNDDTPTILFLGRLVPRKGCAVLLQAIRILAREKQMTKLRVLVCGTGPLADSLKRYVHENGLDAHVEFTGFVTEEDKPRYYASADISAFPSSGGESFGIVLLEAMASGKAAVLAGNNPGYASVMADRPELVFEAKNAELLADKLLELLQNEEKRQELAAWGEHYTALFDVDRVFGQLTELYKQALRSRRNVQ